MKSNVWPDASLLPKDEPWGPAEEHRAALMKLSISVLKLIERTLPYESGIVDEVCANDTITPMRMVHYPPVRPQDQRKGKTQYDASTHTDVSAITLLLQEQSPELEVLDFRTSEWKPVPPNPAVYVVNIGDMLSSWTKNEYKSGLHRAKVREPA
jgi:isopenicillin N synthase-like dioxygenase